MLDNFILTFTLLFSVSLLPHHTLYNNKNYEFPSIIKAINLMVSIVLFILFIITLLFKIWIPS